MKWVERAALSRQICPSAAPRCCQGWLSIGEIKWRSTKASRGRGARMIDLGTQACNLDAIFGLLHQRPPDRRMASAPARAPNIGAPARHITDRSPIIAIVAEGIGLQRLSVDRPIRSRRCKARKGVLACQ
jgi:hypothetical protein